MRFLAAAVCAMAVAGGAGAQTPSFDVASVRMAAPGGRRGEMMHGGPSRIKVEPGALTIRGANFRTCVRWAYHVTDFQVTGPDWIDQQRFDIAAKAAGPASEDELRTMLQGLLADRFKLAVHRQTKETQAWVLSVGKNGPKFKEAKGDGEMEFQADQKRMQISARRMPVSDLIDLMAVVLRAPILDETGLKGRYDATIAVDKYIPEHPTGIGDMISVIVRALQQELGLNLEERKMPVEFVVIDRAEKTPAEN